MTKSLTDSQFKSAKKKLGITEERKRGKSATPIKPLLLIIHGVRMVSWSCPDCGHRNRHLNTGRGSYFCACCGLDTDLKIVI